MDKIWQILVDKAAAAANPRDVSGTVFAGSVGAALITASGNIYTGVSVDTACSIGFCAERNAFGSMLTAGEQEIIKLVAIKNGAVILPCGVCREFLMQLDVKNADMEVLTQFEPLEYLKLVELLPNYWK